MDPIKEYAIENEEWLVRDFTNSHEEEFAQWLNDLDANITTQQHHEDFATNHANYWTFVSEHMKGGTE